MQSTAGAAAALVQAPRIFAASSRPAVLGGKPLRSGRWPAWPVTTEADEHAMLDVLRSGNWFRYRGGESPVDRFETQWARQLGARYCQATSSGTAALITALAALDIGPGDEVLVSPYTFIASVNCILLHHALPVFVDSDPRTAQLDAAKIAERISANTRCILPVHFGGASCDMDRLTSVAREKNLAVVEDACQAHTGEWRGHRLGTIGDAGCYSFQNSKNLTSGEGGALVTEEEALYHRAQTYHNNGNGHFDHDGQFTGNGGNFRMTRWQGALLNEQLTRLADQSQRREANAAYLDELLGQIDGVAPKKKLSGTTRHGYHLYAFDFDPARFAGMDKACFRRALAAEGVPVSMGYDAINREPWVAKFLADRGFQRIYDKQRLARWAEENTLPGNDRLIATSFWLTQNVLLADRADMELIAEAMRRVQRYAAEIVQKSGSGVDDAPG